MVCKHPCAIMPRFQGKRGEEFVKKKRFLRTFFNRFNEPHGTGAPGPNISVFRIRRSNCKIPSDLTLQIFLKHHVLNAKDSFGTKWTTWIPLGPGGPGGPGGGPKGGSSRDQPSIGIVSWRHKIL